jgi:hypothetical protein
MKVGMFRNYVPRLWRWVTLGTERYAGFRTCNRSLGWWCLRLRTGSVHDARFSLFFIDNTSRGFAPSGHHTPHSRRALSLDKKYFPLVPLIPHHASCARPSHSATARPHSVSGHPTLPASRAPHPALRSAASPWQPSTAAPQSALARRCQGVHRATTTPTPLGEGRRRLRHRLPRSAEDTMARGPVCCKCIFQMFYRYVAGVSEICCKRLFKMFHLIQTYIATLFMWMLHMF